MRWPKVFPSWLRDVRRAALVAAIAGVLGVLIPGWNATRTMLAVPSIIGSWVIPLILLTYCFTAMMPLFYFALSRNEAQLEVPRRLGSLSLAAAIVVGLITLAGLPRWFGSFGSYWATIRMLDWRQGAATLLNAVREPATIRELSTLLGVLSNLAYTGLLVAFFRQAAKKSSRGTPVSSFLAGMTKITVIAGALVVAGCLIRLLIMPYVYVELRDTAIQFGRTPPRLATLMVDAVRTLLVQACFFTAPYVVYRSYPRHIEAVESAVALTP